METRQDQIICRCSRKLQRTVASLGSFEQIELHIENSYSWWYNQLFWGTSHPWFFTGLVSYINWWFADFSEPSTAGTWRKIFPTCHCAALFSCWWFPITSTTGFIHATRQPCGWLVASWVVKWVLDSISYMQLQLEGVQLFRSFNLESEPKKNNSHLKKVTWPGGHGPYLYTLEKHLVFM